MKTVILQKLTPIFWNSSLSAAILLFSAACASAQSDPASPDAYNVDWNSPGVDARDSLPVGNGVVGANVWVERNGDLIFYISRNDSLSEVQRLMKLGRVRVHLNPNPFVAGQPFHEVLRLRKGRLDIDAGNAGRAVHLSFLADSGSPILYLKGDSDQPESITVTLEDWRCDDRKLNPTELESSWILRGAPPEWAADATESADHFPSDPNGLLWYHRNSHSVVPRHVAEQGLSADGDLVHDPLVNNTFGGFISGPEFTKTGTMELSTRHETRHFGLQFATNAAQTPTADLWRDQIRRIHRDAVPFELAAARTAQWWSDFWDRSYVFVDGDAGEGGLLNNRHNLRIGADASGHNTYVGYLGRFSFRDRALSDREVAALAGDISHTSPADTNTSISSEQATPLTMVGSVTRNSGPSASMSRGFGGGYLEASKTNPATSPASFTAEAWIRPTTVSGRIFDKITPGGNDGFLFDLYDHRLRFIYGERTFVGETDVPTGEWTHVAAVFDANKNVASLYQNGRRIAGDSIAAGQTTPASAITAAYIYTKYQYACQMRNTFPAHFQGGIFTVDPKFAYYGPDIRKLDVTPDYRFYGANYWWQNTRFLYLPQLAQGNFDLIQPFFKFYLAQAPLFAARAKHYYGANGLYMQECISTFGLPGMGDFGYGEKIYSEQYTRNIWQQCLELTVMLLDYYEYTGDKKFLAEQALPWAKSALAFYDTRFGKDKAGKLRITPTHAVETYWTDVVNDMPSVAGLHYVIERLVALPASASKPQERATWKRLLSELPAIPRRIADGKAIPDNAESYKPERTNYEAPDLYGVFPFRLYGIGHSDYPIEEAREAFRRMPNPDHTCWYQTGIFAALLGLTEDAKKDVQLRASAHLAGFRFPGFFGSPHDWCPDEDGPGNMSNTLQEMLLQCEGNRIRLLPTWPREWDVRFKLHAPRNTIVECVYRHGKIESLKVTPNDRRKDVILPARL